MKTSITANPKRAGQWALHGGAFLFWLLVWEALCRYVGLEVLLPSPAHTLQRLLELGREAAFWQKVLATCLRVVEGFLLAVAVGTLLAAATAASRLLEALFRPLLNVIRATPVASFIILALVWLATDRLPGFIAFLMVVPLVWANVFAGIRGTSRELLEMARLFRLPPGKILRYIYIPQVIPHFVAACSTGLGFAWKSAIAAEVIARPSLAMGKEIYRAKTNLLTLDLFAWTLAVILLSVLLEKLALWGLARLQARLLRAGGEAARQ